MILTELDLLGTRVHQLRALADDLLIQTSQLRALVHRWSAATVPDLEQTMELLAEEREVLETLLGQVREQADDELRLAEERMAAPAEHRSAAPKAVVEQPTEPAAGLATATTTALDVGPDAPDGFAAVVGTDLSAQFAGRQRSLSPKQLKQTAKLPLNEIEDFDDVPLPSKPPPPPAAEALTESPAPVDYDEAETVPTTEDDLASLLERTSWAPLPPADNASTRTSPVDGFRRSQLSRPRSRTGGVSGQAKAGNRDDGGWENDLSRMLDGDVSFAAEPGRDGQADLPPARTGALEDILSGYLKEQD